MPATSAPSPSAIGARVSPPAGPGRDRVAPTGPLRPGRPRSGSATEGWPVANRRYSRLPVGATRPERACLRQRAFTLIEVMLVVSIVAIVIAAGVPTMFRAMRKNPLHKAVNDIVEGCSHARAQAILNGRPMELVIRVDGPHCHLTVEAAREPKRTPTESSGGGPTLVGGSPQSSGSSGSSFSATMPDEVSPTDIFVNFVDYMNMPEARARFYPNGTSDEFAIILAGKDGQRMVKLDLVTGLAETTVLR